MNDKMTYDDFIGVLKECKNSDGKIVPNDKVYDFAIQMAQGLKNCNTFIDKNTHNNYGVKIDTNEFAKGYICAVEDVESFIENFEYLEPIYYLTC